MQDVIRMGEERTAFRNCFYSLKCHLAGKRPVGRSRSWGVGNTECNARVLGFNGMWTEQARDMIGRRGTVIVTLVS